jgi:hypothetical protein
MFNFKDWLFSESIYINNDIKEFPLVVGPGMRPVKNVNSDELKQFVRKSFHQYYGNEFTNFRDRYDIFLKKIHSGYSEIIFSFQNKPKLFRKPEMADPNGDFYHLDLKHNGGKTGYYLHKSPKDAVKEIPQDPNLVYRGMSYEEWQFIRKNGFIQSRNDYNLGDIQNDLTFYGSAETAEYYANGFAPMQFQTSIKKPSIVIAISRDNVKSHQDMPDAIPFSEFAHIGKLSSKEIKHAWMLTPTKSKAGTLDFVYKYIPLKDDNGSYNNLYTLSSPREGSRSGPFIRYELRKII